MHNENIALSDIEQYDEELFEQLSCLSDSLRADGYMDFSFAIYLAVQELKKIDKKEGSYIEKFKYLFVDEYHDINPIQEEFIKTLSGFLDMLFVVGDDDQSIYGWRGANVQNILTFKDRYSDVKIHKLLVNFRSTNAIEFKLQMILFKEPFRLKDCRKKYDIIRVGIFKICEICGSRRERMKQNGLHSESNH